MPLNDALKYLSGICHDSDSLARRELHEKYATSPWQTDTLSTAVSIFRSDIFGRYLYASVKVSS